jgi:hypothetical protein
MCWHKLGNPKHCLIGDRNKSVIKNIEINVKLKIQNKRNNNK